MRGAEGWPPCYLSTVRREKDERWMGGEKRRRAESTYRGDNRLNCQIHTFSSVPCVCVCVCLRDTFRRGQMLWFTVTRKRQGGQGSVKRWHLMKRSHVSLLCCVLSLPLDLLFHFPHLYFYPASRFLPHALPCSLSSIPLALSPSC